MKTHKHHPELPKRVFVRAYQSARCPTCKAAQSPEAGITALSFGEYINGKWRTIGYQCSACASRGVALTLDEIAAWSARIQRRIVLARYRGFAFPAWLEAARDSLGLWSEGQVQ